MAIKLPMKCKECTRIGDYTEPPFGKDPHHCCELIWMLCHGDYRVDPDTIDTKCPLRNENILKGIEEVCKSIGIKEEECFINESDS